MAALLQFTDRVPSGFDLGLVIEHGALFGLGENRADVGATVRAEDVVGEEVGQPVHELVLSDPEALGMPRWRIALGGLANVVDGGVSDLAAHPAATVVADQVRTQAVGTLGHGMAGVAAGSASGSLARLAHLMSGDEFFLGHQRLVGGSR
ncbi:hypothetical protein [Actinomadura sp. SCN-SB]|uniref:hypothetical protein n=1 Tax=Actinomadura sp. SCN-SB TaxID=3373092 RepID=UPI003751F242